MLITHLLADTHTHTNRDAETRAYQLLNAKEKIGEDGVLVFAPCLLAIDVYPCLLVDHAAAATDVVVVMAMAVFSIVPLKRSAKTKYERQEHNLGKLNSQPQLEDICAMMCK